MSFPQQLCEQCDCLVKCAKLGQVMMEQNQRLEQLTVARAAQSMGLSNNIDWEYSRLNLAVRANEKRINQMLDKHKEGCLGRRK